MDNCIVCIARFAVMQCAMDRYGLTDLILAYRFAAVSYIIRFVILNLTYFSILLHAAVRRSNG